MNKKKKIIIIITSILIILGIIIGYIYQSLQNKTISLPKSKLEEIKDIVDNKESVLIYYANDSCDLCKERNKMIDFYEREYKLSFKKINPDNFTDKELKEFFKILSVKQEETIMPAVIFIKEGKWVATANEMYYEDILRRFLVDYGFYDESILENDYSLNDENFPEFYASKERRALLIFTYDSNGYTLRKNLFDLSEKYNFTFATVYHAMSSGGHVSNAIMKEIGVDNFSVPLLVVTQENKVIDYMTPKNQVDMAEFLRKNKVIND